MADRNHTRAPNGPQHQELILLYDSLCEQMALQQFYYEALEGIALLHHCPLPVRHGQGLFISWLKDQQGELKTRFRAYLKRYHDSSAGL